MQHLVAKAPMRVDLSGGTTDIPPLFLFHHPAPVINVAVSIFGNVSLRPSRMFTIISQDQRLAASAQTLDALKWEKNPELELPIRILKSFQLKHGVEMEISSEAPIGSGLGASSSLAIATVAALAIWTRKKITKTEIVEHAKSIETQTIRVPTGYQDYWAAVYGGLRAYEISLQGALSHSCLASSSFLDAFENHMCIVYTGKPHFSGTNNWELFKKHIERDAAISRFFDMLKTNAINMRRALEAESIERVAENLRKDWHTRKKMLPAMTTPRIDSLEKKTLRAGALALRVCGAGGGGCALVLVPPSSRGKIGEIVEQLHMQIIPAKIVSEGVKVFR